MQALVAERPRAGSRCAGDGLSPAAHPRGMGRRPRPGGGSGMLHSPSAAASRTSVSWLTVASGAGAGLGSDARPAGRGPVPLPGEPRPPVGRTDGLAPPEEWARQGPGGRAGRRRARARLPVATHGRGRRLVVERCRRSPGTRSPSSVERGAADLHDDARRSARSPRRARGAVVPERGEAEHGAGARRCSISKVSAPWVRKSSTSPVSEDEARRGARALVEERRAGATRYAGGDDASTRRAPARAPPRRGAGRGARRAERDGRGAARPEGTSRRRRTRRPRARGRARRRRGGARGRGRGPRGSDPRGGGSWRGRRAASNAGGIRRGVDEAGGAPPCAIAAISAWSRGVVAEGDGAGRALVEHDAERVLIAARVEVLHPVRAPAPGTCTAACRAPRPRR